MTNTNAAKVQVVTVSNALGDAEVHGVGCADLKRKKRNRDDDYTWTVGSAVELSHEFWADQISDTTEWDSPEGWAVAEEWVGTFRFLPCAPAFPGDKPARKQTRAERTAEAGAAEAARCAASSSTAEPVVAGEPHAFSAKGSAKASACVSCGRTWAASAHRKYRAAV